MRNKPFSYFDVFVIIFGKDRATKDGVEREGAEAAADAIEKDNDEDREFVDAIENYREESREERRKQRRHSYFNL